MQSLKLINNSNLHFVNKCNELQFIFTKEIEKKFTVYLLSWF